MKMTEEDSDVFEITDFTTASEWERFVARLEEIIHEWRLTTEVPASPLAKAELTNGVWKEKVEQLIFADFKFTVTRHYLKKDQDKETSPDNKDDVQEGKQEDAIEKQDDPTPALWLDLLSVDNDFPSRAHCLVRWYGLRDFVTIAPASGDVIDSESRANILLSSVAMAQQNTGCQVPMFIQVQKHWRRLYMGQCETGGYRTTFEMVHLNYTPQQYGHLSGLIDVFKSKLNSPVSPLPPVNVSVRFTFILQDWPHYSWPQAPPDMDSMMEGEVGCTEFGDLPFGACEDPVIELQLSTTWPSLSEEVIVDNDVYSDLDPLQAPDWSVRVRMADKPQCLMGDYIWEFMKLCRRHESTTQLLGAFMKASDSKEDISQAFNRLTEPGTYALPSIGTVVTKATSKLQIKPEEAPIAADLLNEILLFLFPDAKSDEESEDSSSSTSDTQSSKQATPAATPATTPGSDTPPSVGLAGQAGHYKEMFRQFKSAPAESLTHRLALCMCIVNHSYGGLRAVAHLWQEFVLEMRYRWENNFVIPDLETGSPNLGCSLLHQKLMMLNCCIRHKISREELQRQGTFDKTDSDSGATAKPGKLDLSSSDDEFFECDVSDDSDSKRPSSGGKVRKSASFQSKRSMTESGLKQKSDSDKKKSDDGEKLSSRVANMDVSPKQPELNFWDQPDIIEKPKPKPVSPDAERENPFKDSLTHQPEGRMRKSGMTLINSEADLFIPVTQEPAPMTEDLLEEQAEVLAKLGTSPEGASLRARMQSACLLSDMESFKAANPGCTISDFVRWYSPRDWIEEEVIDDEGNVVKRGQLSQRMQIPGNMWMEVWQSAKAVPVRRQKRLFDDTKEAEKVLHFLASMNPADLANRLMPMLIHAAITKLFTQQESKIPVIQKHINAVITKATKIMRLAKPDHKKFEDLGRQLASMEVMITQAQSLRTKFSQEKEVTGKLTTEVQTFVAALLEPSEVPVAGAAHGPVGSVIHSLFAAAQKSAYMLLEDDYEEEDDPQRPAAMPSDFPLPAGKEYILRCTAAVPAPWSRVSPHRMYCVVMKDEFRLAGAFTTDTTFQ